MLACAAAIATGAAQRDLSHRQAGVMRTVNGAFCPDDFVTRTSLAYSLVQSLGLQDAARAHTGDVTVAAEVDRIYTGAPAELALVDGALQRSVHIHAEGSHTAVVWNPGATLAAGMADLQDDEYRRFVCVETANAGAEVITLAPGRTHTLVAQIAAGPY